MAHVHDDEWIDFVRGTLEADRAAAVTAHLERGCARCLRARNLWHAAVEAAGRERSYTPPAGAVRIARSQFAGSPSQEEWTLRALLVFDSWRDAAAAGVRGGAAVPRHLLYRAGAVSIDLRLEQGGSSAQAILMGQVAHEEAAAAGATTTYVIALLDGDRQLDATSTNRFGEFELQFKPQDDLALVVSAPHRPAVRVPLAEAVGGC